MRTMITTFVLALSLVPATAWAHGDCEEDADCEEGQICFEEACSDPCSTDADCPDGEVCADETACQHEAEDEGGCSTAPSDPGFGFALVGLALAAAGIKASRRKRK